MIQRFDAEFPEFRSMSPIKEGGCLSPEGLIRFLGSVKVEFMVKWME